MVIWSSIHDWTARSIGQIDHRMNWHNICLAISISTFLRFCSSVLWKVIIYKSSVVWWLLLTCLLLLGRNEMKMILGWWHVCPPLNQWLMEMHKIRAIFPIRFISFSFDCWLSILVMKMITLFQTNLTPMTMILERVLLIFFFWLNDDFDTTPDDDDDWQRWWNN